MNDYYKGDKSSIKLHKLSIDKIVVELKKNYSARFSSLLYKKLIALIRYISVRYSNLTDNDKESFAMEELWRTVEDYDFDGRASFITLFKVYYTNRLNQESKSRRNQKRIANFEKELGSVNNLFYGERDLKEDVEIMDSCIENLDDFKKVVLRITIEQTELSDNEKEYCKHLVEFDYKDVEAAQVLNITPQAIHYMKKRIRSKLKEKIMDFI
jgi:DNA-directed RNA polymerase specialized sigma24 family protein